MKLENAEEQHQERINIAKEKNKSTKGKKMPLTKKGKKIKRAFDRQYGKDADKVFYASINKGTFEKVLRKVFERWNAR